jgi:hypothetical protein
MTKKKITELRKWYPACLYDGSKFVSVKKNEINSQVRLVGTYEMRNFFWVGKFYDFSTLWDMLRVPYLCVSSLFRSVCKIAKIE